MICRISKKTIMLGIIALYYALFSSIYTFAAKMIVPAGYDSLVNASPFGNEIVVTGDSYAQHFLKDESNRDLKFYAFTAEGTTLQENAVHLAEAFDSINKMVLLSISVNDQVRGTHPAIFEMYLRAVLDRAKETKKIVFMHTYIHHPQADLLIGAFPTFTYDDTIRKLAAEYDNVYYIDMSDCSDAAFSTGDYIHYSKRFNDILYDRLKAKIDELTR